MNKGRTALSLVTFTIILVATYYAYLNHVDLVTTTTTTTNGYFIIIPQVYADTIIQAFNMTEHEANKQNKNNNDYCYSSECLMQKANELMDEAETQAYWNDINSQYYLSDLDKAVKELERLD